jgi:ketosteroid isomerase-like protein
LYRRASWSGFIDLLDEGVEFDFSAYPVPGSAVVRGKDAAIDWCRSYWGTWDEYILEATAIIDAGGDRVVVVQHERARGKGSGVRLERHWAVIFTIRTGRVVRFQAFRTSEDALAAAGPRG